MFTFIFVFVFAIKHMYKRFLCLFHLVFRGVYLYATVFIYAKIHSYIRCFQGYISML
jgi:hypothetical protein